LTKWFFQGSEDPYRHAAYVWENYVMEANHSRIAIVAHSAGGAITKELVMWHNYSVCKLPVLLYKMLLFCQASAFKEQFSAKVFAVAFTSSSHNKLVGPAYEHLRKVFKNLCSPL
jgi:acetyl esterase/lipase